jgi:hypothetical protein
MEAGKSEAIIALFVHELNEIRVIFEKLVLDLGNRFAISALDQFQGEDRHSLRPTHSDYPYLVREYPLFLAFPELQDKIRLHIDQKDR